MDKITIYAVQTGLVRVKKAQRSRQSGGMMGLFFSSDWTGWLPIYAWVIKHPEGIILVDTGETAQTAVAGYFPRWHPYYRLAVQFDVTPEQEVGPQLLELGMKPEDVRTVIMTHLHTDHAGGLHYFSNSDIYVSGDEYRRTSGISGWLQGYLTNRWPDWLQLMMIPFTDTAVGPFPSSYPVTEARDVIIVPTPGHTPGHVSVIVKSDELSYFLAGDTSYNQALMLAGEVDGVSPDPQITKTTLAQIRQYAADTPTVYLPSHDPEAAERLERRQAIVL